MKGASAGSRGGGRGGAPMMRSRAAAMPSSMVQSSTSIQTLQPQYLSAVSMPSSIVQSSTLIQTKQPQKLSAMAMRPSASIQALSGQSMAIENKEAASKKKKV